MHGQKLVRSNKSVSRNSHPYFVGFKKIKNSYKSISSDFISRNQKILTLKGIDLTKVRFVNSPAFVYDFMKDIINPELKLEVPMMSNGLFDPNQKIQSCWCG